MADPTDTHMDDDDFDPDERAAAEALDSEIDSVLGGRSAPTAAPTLTWLASAMRTDPPAPVLARVRDALDRVDRRRWRPMRLAALALAYLYISQGVGNILIGDWVARGIGEDYSPHITREGGLALIAAGLAVGAGAISRRFTSVSAVVGTPLGVVLGGFGVTEIGVFAAGAVLHITEGIVAIALGYTYWRYRRDSSGPVDEEGA